MLVTVLTESLSKALTIASRFTGGKIQLPVLANILIKAEKNKLIICATNLETSISISIGAKVEKEGEITVPGKVISELVSNLPPGQITLKEEEEKVYLESASFKSVILGVNASDFPSVPGGFAGHGYKIDSSVVVKVLSKSLFAVSNDDTRPVLTGMLLVLNSGNIKFVATDGFRLSFEEVSVESVKVEKEQRIILPKTALAELLRIAPMQETLVFEFNNEDNQAIFVVGDIILSSRIIQGDFPDFERIVPKDPQIHIELDREDLIKAVKLSSVFAKDSANVIRFKIDKKGVEISAESAKSGNQRLNLEAKVQTSDDLVCAYNYRFIEEFLNSVECDSIKLSLTDANVPGLFLDPNNPNYYHIIMPIKLNV